MALFLRRIKKTRWNRSLELQWLAPGEAPADTFHDLSPKENILSFWKVEDKEADLTRLVAALAATREALQEYDFALLHEDALATIGIKIKQTPGNSANDQINKSLHFSLVELTTDKISHIAKEIWANETKGRINRPEIRTLILEGVASGTIDKERIRPDLCQKLELA